LDAVHTPVMCNEIIDYLINEDTEVFLDCTLGEGGHSKEILTRFSGLRVFGVDRDPEILKFAENRLSRFAERFTSINSNFSQTDIIGNKLGILRPDAILIDLGISVFHYKKSGRGFSFLENEPLDMRLDNNGFSVIDVVNTYDKNDLADIFFKFGEERFGNRIADRILDKRKTGRINTTVELANIVKDAIPAKFHGKIHPATKVFQALRIFVNDELEHIENGLNGLFELLKSGGRMGVISFHSLEDRIVKNFFNELAKGCICPKELQRCVCNNQSRIKWIAKMVTAGEEEIRSNPPSRSAKLRIVEKV